MDEIAKEYDVIVIGTGKLDPLFTDQFAPTRGSWEEMVMKVKGPC